MTGTAGMTDTGMGMTGTSTNTGTGTSTGPGTVVAVCVAYQIKAAPNRAGRTAIDKRPAPGPVEVGPLGLIEDTQCDKPRHGGADKALYAYAEDEARRWADELGRPVPPGLFGENLRLRGLPVTDAVVGERWQVGSSVLVEVTSPRTPCATFACHMAEPDWMRRFSDRTDVGTYLRVRVGGLVSAGDAVVQRHVPEHGVTVREMFAALTNRAVDPDRLDLLLAEQTLPDALRTKLERLLAHR